MTAAAHNEMKFWFEKKPPLKIGFQTVSPDSQQQELPHQVVFFISCFRGTRYLKIGFWGKKILKKSNFRDQPCHTVSYVYLLLVVLLLRPWSGQSRARCSVLDWVALHLCSSAFAIERHAHAQSFGRT
jgi:hypothetical protein